MPHPETGQPFIASPGPRLSVGDPDAAAGTDAYNGVIIVEPGAPSAYIVDSTIAFDLKVYVKTALSFFPMILPGTFSVEFHIHDLEGNPVGTFAGGALVSPDVPSGASSPAAGDVVTWYSSTATIPATTLNPGETYRITTHGHDTAGTAMVFHDGTIVHTED